MKQAKILYNLLLTNNNKSEKIEQNAILQSLSIEWLLSKSL